MKQSIFKKQLSAKGKQGFINAEVVATMNYDSKTISGTHAVTHDDYTRNIPVHKVEVFINGKLWQKVEGLDSDLSVYNESEAWIEKTTEHIFKLANIAPAKTFAERMSTLFS